MQIRYLEEKDLAQAMDLWDYCFEKKDDPFFQWYFESYCLKENRILGGFEENSGRLLTMLHLNPYRLLLNGSAESVPYIVGVATAPDARGHHLAADLIREAFSRLKAEGTAFAVLMPINAGIYLPCGFAFTYMRRIYDMPLKDLAQAGKKESGLWVRCVEDLEPEIFAATYEKLALRYNGLPKRDKKDWEKLLEVHRREKIRAATVRSESGTLAYMLYSLEKKGTFEVQELAAPDPRGKRSLLAFAASHLSEAERFLWSAPPDDLTFLDFKDASLSGQAIPFMMARCVNVKKALEDFFAAPQGATKGATGPFKFSIEVKDPFFVEGAARLLVEKDADKAARVSDFEGRADYRMDTGTFTQLVFGFLGADALIRESRLVRAKDAPYGADLAQIFVRKETFINEYF